MRKAIIRNPRITHQNMSPKLFKLWNENGKSFPNYSDFGGYPLYYIFNTGEIVCGKHATEEIKAGSPFGSFTLEDVGINYENPDLWCEHGHRIESAYAEDEAVENPRKVSQRSVKAFGNRERYKWNATRNPTRNGKRLPDSYKGTSVSWGTLNPEHLLDAFIDFLEAHKKGAKLRDAKRELKRLKSLNGHATEETQWILEELFEEIDSIAPTGTSFGAHEGDGSDFGFWEYEDYD